MSLATQAYRYVERPTGNKAHLTINALKSIDTCRFTQFPSHCFFFLHHSALNTLNLNCILNTSSLAEALENPVNLIVGISIIFGQTNTT